MIWVIARTLDDGAVVYWAGTTDEGQPKHARHWSDAHRFTTARAARECAATHPKLANSAIWRVQQITARCERLS